ncbi:hypothetical protein BraRD5C2_67590 [Bradyrhizobium sp. RD5-C2]|nr:hypothetical protein BraRD5C2_67590 [Bradyrhizobium sp. RD5-C2]
MGQGAGSSETVTVRRPQTGPVPSGACADLVAYLLAKLSRDCAVSALRQTTDGNNEIRPTEHLNKPI